MDRGGRVKLPQAGFKAFARFGIGQIGFGDQDAVGNGGLFDAFGMVIKLPRAMQGIDGGHHAIKAEFGREQRIGHQGMQDRGRVGQAGGFDDHAVEFRYLATGAFDKQIAQARNQITAHRTADAAGIQQYDILGHLADQKVIKPDFAKFIDQNGGFCHAVVSQKGIEKGCFATAKEAGDHGGGNAVKLFVGNRHV